MRPAPIGIFDSGFGGLSVYKGIKALLPQYSYIYLGDNARAPYGCLSFDEIYENTLQAVKLLFEKGCQLIILACNTASAQALRTIQQTFLPSHYPDRRVLGVIRPCTERVLNWSPSRHVGLLATVATVASNSYGIEINKYSPEVELSQLPCPQWVELVERGDVSGDKCREVVAQDLAALLQKDEEIDTVILACTHFSHLEQVIHESVPTGVRIVHQGPIVARALQRYLEVHSDLEKRCLKTASEEILTTGDAVDFMRHGRRFMDFTSQAVKIRLT